MTPATLFDKLMHLRQDQQQQFWDKLSKSPAITPDELQALQIGYSVFTMGWEPGKYDALKQAMAEVIYTDIQQKNREKSARYYAKNKDEINRRRREKYKAEGH